MFFVLIRPRIAHVKGLHAIVREIEQVNKKLKDYPEDCLEYEAMLKNLSDLHDSLYKESPDPHKPYNEKFRVIGED